MTRELVPLELPPLGAGPHVFLSGPMAVGKSTVAPLLAARLGRPHLDLDREVEARAGATVGAIFRDRGEPAFRALELETLRALAARDAPTVFALGGGTVVCDEARRLALSRGTVVTLRGAAAELARRAGSERPLLAGAPDEAARARRLESLVHERRAAYAESHVVVDARERSPDEIAEALVVELGRAPVLVALGERSYRATVAPGELGRVGPLLLHAGARGAVLCVTDENVRAYAAVVAASLVEAGFSTATVVLPPGEVFKNVRSLETIWDAAIAHGVDRHGALVAVGGGVVGDVTGMAAATLMRGVRWAQVPTTSLSMVDAAVGGKTAIDRPEGKNLVGAFHQPSLVVIDPDTLATLPPREYRAGLAEVLKCAWIAGEAEVAALEAAAGDLVRRDGRAIRDAIATALRVKARIVAHDEREEHARLALNLGHTLGHALETASGLELLHGEAVALGLLAAHRVATRLGHGGDEPRAERLVRGLGLPTSTSLWDAHLETLVGRDKKSAGRAVRFVVPRRPGELATVALRADEVVALGRP